ncbi:hypothetical protein GCM10027456_30690 [Kineosporia babensis]
MLTLSRSLATSTAPAELVRATENDSIGGLALTEATLEAVRPTGPSALAQVTRLTPAACRRKPARKRSLSEESGLADVIYGSSCIGLVRVTGQNART